MSPTPPPGGFLITLDPTWPAARIARAILERVRDVYGDRLDIQGVHDKMDEIWVALQADLTDAERARLAEVTHVSVPLNDFNARIAAPPSRLGYFILFDAMVDLRLWDLFTAPRNPMAWAAAYVRAAWGNYFQVAHWVGPALERLTHLSDADGYPDSYSLAAARDFIFAHECGHFFRDHLLGGSHRQLHFGGDNLVVYDPAFRQEAEADAFACEVLARTKSRPLAIQQMGVDWLFGYLGAVLGMRQRAEGRREGDPDPYTMDESLAQRRALCWSDFERRRAASPHEMERTPETIETIRRVRVSVDNFNRVFPAALADIYAELPDELLRHCERMTDTPLTDEELAAHEEELVRLGERAIERFQTTPRRRNWRTRFRKLMRNLF